MLHVKPYLLIPIEECGEPLAPIPRELFAFFDPHPYVAAGAGALYGSQSPWRLRKGVLEALVRAQNLLFARKKGWKIKIFDAFRPNEVQSFMVEREFGIKAKNAGLAIENINKAQREELAVLVYKYWAPPSDDPARPPPHSTGAVLDCTLEDERGREVDMGSPIDEGAAPAAPDYFKEGPAAENRALLHDVLRAEGFRRHPDEWWHFSRGDQLWAWLERQENPKSTVVARYGRVTPS